MSGFWAGGGAYEEWATFLQEWARGGRGRGEHLPALREADFPPDAWERIGNRLTAALSQRLQGWAAALTAAIGACASEPEVGRALAQGRDGLREIRAFTCHPGLPAAVRDKLLESVDRQVRSAQEELERQAERMRRDRATLPMVEGRLRTLRDNRLTVVTVEPAAGDGPSAPDVSAGAAGWAVPADAAPRRRVIVD